METVMNRPVSVFAAAGGRKILWNQLRHDHLRIIDQAESSTRFLLQRAGRGQRLKQ